MSDDNTAPGSEGENADDAGDVDAAGVGDDSLDTGEESQDRVATGESERDETSGQAAERRTEREVTLGDRAEELDRREERLNQREEGLDKRADDLGERAADLDERVVRLRERREELVDREDELDRREAGVEEAEQDIADRRAALNDREQDLNERAGQLDRQEATLERYVEDQLGDVEASLSSTVQEAVYSAFDGISVGDDDDGRFGTFGNLRLGLVGLVLTVGGVANAVAIQFEFGGVFGDPMLDYGLSAFVVVVGLAANLAAAASRV
jgi:prefoldin subunit 5